MKPLRRDAIVGGLVWLVGAGAFGVAALGREVPLAIHPAALGAENDVLSLLPKADALIDGDAVSWYEKAAQAMPKESRDKQIRQWLDLPVVQLPMQQAEAVIQEHMDSLRAVVKATRCKQCNWPQWKPGTTPRDLNLTPYRKLAFVVRLWARLEIARGGHEGAMLALQTGFGMARHLAQAPTLVQVLVGIAIAEVVRAEADQFIQTENAPNLYWAVAHLPKPFADIENAIATEKKAVAAQVDEALFKQLESQNAAAYDRVRQIGRRLDSHIGVLQCAEAVRSYAAAHGGQLPQNLSDITGVSLPIDAISGKPYVYRKTGATAVLESTAPDGEEKVQIRYLISVRN
ncbi:MAG: hypothetical protein JW741_21670, partial [Sedimentisphaerales bacterium]|nr:hypothetical protein [Sedimentisphaerales bacterium]